MKEFFLPQVIIAAVVIRINGIGIHRHIKTAGTSYHVGDNCEAHRSRTEKGCRLFIVD